MSYLRIQHRLPDSFDGSAFFSAPGRSASLSQSPLPPANLTLTGDFADAANQAINLYPSSAPSSGSIPPRTAGFSMVDMIGLSRSFELAQKSIQSEDSMTQTLTSVLS